MKILQVKPNSRALVDDVDYERLSKRSWWLSGYGYAVAKTSYKIDGKLFGKSLYLHREVLHAPKGLEVDHINGYKLDCRKRNLRFATRAQNVQNTCKQTRSQSPYKGVYKHAQNPGWVAQVHHQYLGTYPTAEVAALIYNKHASALYGEYAKLNVLRVKAEVESLQ